MRSTHSLISVPDLLIWERGRPFYWKGRPRILFMPVFYFENREGDRRRRLFRPLSGSLSEERGFPPEYAPSGRKEGGNHSQKQMEITGKALGLFVEPFHSKTTYEAQRGNLTFH